MKSVVLTKEERLQKIKEQYKIKYGKNKTNDKLYVSDDIIKKLRNDEEYMLQVILYDNDPRQCLSEYIKDLIIMYSEEMLEAMDKNIFIDKILEKMCIDNKDDNIITIKYFLDYYIFNK